MNRKLGFDVNYYKGLVSLCFLLISFWAKAQHPLNFRPDYSLEKAIQVAQIEDKNIFIDTYAPWCGPCKLMDLQFQDEKLGAFMNKNYINIKINMDSSYGPAVRSKYDVFFLPTLLIIDKYGNAKYASEGALTSDELLALAVNFHNEVYKPELVSTEFPVVNETIKSKISEDTAEIGAKNQKPIQADLSQEVKKNNKETNPSKSEEKILYTQNDALDDPEYLYNLTYLKLQLQDGSHWASAKKYLATQENWNTEKNMKFIYDFVRSPQSEMFRHILENREAYYDLFGKESVDRSIEIMINMRLFQGVPRPERDEVYSLYKIIDSGVAEVATLNYLLNKYEEEEDYDNYVKIAEEYINKLDPDNTRVINKWVNYSSKSNSTLPVRERIKMIQHAIETQGGTNYALYQTLSKLYIEKKKKKKARLALVKAIELAKASNLDLSELKQLELAIQNL